MDIDIRVREYNNVSDRKAIDNVLNSDVPRLET